MAGWTLAPGYEHLAADFGSIDAVFALDGERLTRDPLSEVIRIERDGINYYVKRYTGAGKHMRRFLGRPGLRPNGRTSSSSPSGASLPPKWWPGGWSAMACRSAAGR